ncbi:MAG: hypothetical protein LBD33_00930 [Puniceicoccales bacterium]|nr:hypothetical protein [Puniceicoccales bacterium]
MVEHGRSGGNVKVSIMNAFMQKFMDELRNSKNKDSYLGIVSNGSHHTIYYKTANGVRRSFSLWLPHHMDSVYYSAGGISSAIDAMDRICYVPGSEKQGQT